MATRPYFDNTHEPMMEAFECNTPPPSERSDHPTPKPVQMIARMLKTSCPEKQIVLDPFLGSGTTLIAAELENRTCYGMELDRRYVDIICRRWQQLTGIMPELEGTDTPTDFIGTADQ